MANTPRQSRTCGEREIGAFRSVEACVNDRPDRYRCEDQQQNRPEDEVCNPVRFDERLSLVSHGGRSLAHG